MHKNSLETVDIINLIESFVFLSEGAKTSIKASIAHEVLNLDLEKKKTTIYAIFKVFNLFGNFATEDLFYNGKITFKGDNEYIYNSVAKDFEDQHELILFPGCIIAKGNNNSYLSLNIRPQKIDSSNQKFNFHYLVTEALKPPAISILIDAEHYPSLLKNF
jgi:hypothetical protein